MIRNYFKIAWRNLKRHRLYSAINLIGLSIGLTFVLLIGAFIWQELQVNSDIKNVDRQYILTSKWTDPNMGPAFTTLAPLAQRLQEEYPQLVANYYRWDGITSTISKGDLHFRESIQIGDETLLDAFGYTLIYGNPTTAFNDPYAIALTEEMAIKYFGKTEVLNETLEIENFSGAKKSFLITAVLQSIPQNSVNQFRKEDVNYFFTSKKALSYFDRTPFDDWTNVIALSYITLKKGIHASQLNEPIKQLLANNTTETIQKNLKIVPQSLREFYLKSNNGIVERTLYTLSFIAIFILVMAIVNYMNIAISHAASRMREIGVRKVLGGSRSHIVIQFLTESVLFALVALSISLLLFITLKGWFGSILGKDIPRLLSFPWEYSIPLLFITVFIGLVAGLYPALQLSSLATIQSLKGKGRVGSGTLLRKFLVGFQFCVAFVLIVIAIIVTKQTSFFFEDNLGYEKEAVVSATVPRDWSEKGVAKMETIRSLFKELSEIEEVSLSYEIPDGNHGSSLPTHRSDKNPDNDFTAKILVSDSAFLNTYKISLRAGQFFSNTIPMDEQVVINEKSLLAFGWDNPKDAINQNITYGDWEEPGKATIVGVVKDFHFGSKQNVIAPQLFFNVKAIPRYRYFSFKINNKDIQGSLAAIKSKWNALLPGAPFNYTFMDDTLAIMYADELQLQKASYAATALALALVFLGIFGLVSLNIHKRIKEIGIRKVLGASGHQISMLFFKDFLSTFLFSILVASPLGYIITKMWLNNYAYQITVHPGTFLGTAAVLLLVVFLLVSIQTLNASRANPVNSLKTE